MRSAIGPRPWAGRCWTIFRPGSAKGNSASGCNWRRPITAARSIAPPPGQPEAPQYTDEGGILNLGIIDAAQARRQAVKEGLDVLIVAILTGKAVKVAADSNRSRLWHSTSSTSISNEMLLKIKPLNSPVAGSSPPPNERDVRTGLDMVNDVVTLFEEKLFLVDLPHLTPQDARRRADVLAEQPPADP